MGFYDNSNVAPSVCSIVTTLYAILPTSVRRELSCDAWVLWGCQVSTDWINGQHASRRAAWLRKKAEKQLIGTNQLTEATEFVALQAA